MYSTHMCRAQGRTHIPRNPPTHYLHTCSHLVSAYPPGQPVQTYPTQGREHLQEGRLLTRVCLRRQLSSSQKSTLVGHCTCTVLVAVSARQVGLLACSMHDPPQTPADNAEVTVCCCVGQRVRATNGDWFLGTLLGGHSPNQPIHQGEAGRVVGACTLRACSRTVTTKRIKCDDLQTVIHKTQVSQATVQSINMKLTAMRVFRCFQTFQCSSPASREMCRPTTFGAQHLWNALRMNTVLTMVEH